MAVQVQEKENNEGWFLFMQMDLELLRLDIGRLLPVVPARPPTARPEFQVVNKYRFPDGNKTVPMNLAYTAVDDRLYMLGGNWFEGSSWNGKSIGKQQQWGNLEVYECELEVSDGPETDPVLVCKRSHIPSMTGHKINPIVINLDSKIYVLARTFTGVVEEHWPPLFEVFDPHIGSWRVLPNIPSIGGLLNATYIYKHFYWGNKIVVTSMSRDRACSAHSFFSFDTIQENWEDASAIGVEGFPNYPVCDFAYYDTFLIAKRSLSSEVVAYQLDSDGVPREVRVLDELRGIFYPRFEAVWDSLVTHLGDGLMCLVYHGLGPKEESYTSEDEETDGDDGADDGAGGDPKYAGPVMSVRVVLFQLSVSDNLVLSASIEVVETYELKQNKCPTTMCSPFIKRGDLSSVVI